MFAEPELTRRIGAGGQEHGLARFSLERLITDIDALYRRLLAEAVPR